VPHEQVTLLEEVGDTLAEAFRFSRRSPGLRRLRATSGQLRDLVAQAFSDASQGTQDRRVHHTAPKGKDG